MITVSQLVPMLWSLDTFETGPFSYFSMQQIEKAIEVIDSP